MPDQENRWLQVGERIRYRIEDDLRVTWAEFERMSGISFKTVKRYIAGNPIKRVDKRSDLCKALGWTPDSVQRILDGGEPEVDPQFQAILDSFQRGRALATTMPSTAPHAILELNPPYAALVETVEQLSRQVRRLSIMADLEMPDLPLPGEPTSDDPVSRPVVRSARRASK